MNQFTYDILMRAYETLAPLSQTLITSSSGSSGINQEALVRNILSSPHYELYLPSHAYRKRFWKVIIGILKAADEELDEAIYNVYVDLLSKSTTGSNDIGTVSP